MKWIIAATAACALTAAAPAFAAGPNSDQTQMNQDPNQTQLGGKQTTAAGTSMDEHSGQSGPSSRGQSASLATTQQKLRDALNQAGFSNVVVLGESYLIQAQDSQGNTIYMAVHPAASAPGSATTGAGGSSANGLNPGSNSDLNPNSNSGGSSGTNNNQ